MMLSRFEPFLQRIDLILRYPDLIDRIVRDKILENEIVQLGVVPVHVEAIVDHIGVLDEMQQTEQIDVVQGIVLSIALSFTLNGCGHVF